MRRKPRLLRSGISSDRLERQHGCLALRLPHLHQEGTLLLDMVADIGTNRFEYIYDFGDHWSHTIKIVKPMPAVPGIGYPLLIDAVGRCPLEDSGGPPG